MDNIFKNIKKKYIKISINNLFGVILLFFIFVFLIFIISMIITDKFNVIYLIFISLFLLFDCYGCVLNFEQFLYSRKIAKNPELSALFKRYGDIKKIEKIIKEVYDNIEFEDDVLIISKNYILAKKDIETLIKCDDVLEVNKIIHKFNNTPTHFSILLKDKFSDRLFFKYSRNQKKNIDKAIILIQSKCKNIKKIS